MCGLVLVLDRRPSDDLPATLGRMAATQTHRGPDGQQQAVLDFGAGTRVGMAFARLAILDLDPGAMQPMRSACGRYSLMFNGEIYNYRELRDALGAAGGLPASSGDTAVLLAWLVREGPRALARLVGMWALTLVDHQERRVLVARDRMGVKPLYWHLDTSGDRLAFSSEQKALLVGARGRFSLDAQAVARYMLQSSVYDTEGTFFNGIQRVPPGHYAWIGLDAPAGAQREGRFEPPRFQAYWRHPREACVSRSFDVATAIEQLRETLLDAVRLRLRSDVPMGLMLSGGLDSSVLAACVHGLGQQANMRIISATSSDPASNEEPFIDEVARHLGMQPTKVKIDLEPAAILDELPDVLWHNEVPLTSLPMWAFRRLMQTARGLDATVLISGQGADEQLGGYRKFLAFYFIDRLKHLHWLDAGNMAAGLLVNRTLGGLSLSEARRYVRFLRPAAGEGALTAHMQRMPLADNGPADCYEQRELLDLKHLSLPALLNYEDKQSMAESREVRVPFLDHRVVELLASVPPEYKLRAGWTKWILRQAFARDLPAAIAWRRDKRGFNVPEEHWCRTAFRPTFEAWMSEGLLAAEHGIVQMDGARRMVAQFVQRRPGVGYKDVLNLFLLEMWLRRFSAYLSKG